MKFNEKAKEPNLTLNHEGARAYKLSAEMELYTAVVTSMLNDNFYEKGGERLKRIKNLVKKTNPQFVARLAVYARTQMNLRSVPLLLTVALASVHSGDDLVARTVAQVVQRADEITELLACYQKLNPTGDKRKKLAKVSNQILKGLKAAFNRFDEYQFAKYDRDNAEVKLRDALFLVHPKAKDAAQQAIFDKIVTGSLDTPYTWETELSELGKTEFSDNAEREAAFARKWEELVESRRMGYMATLRNLRNMLKMNVADKTIRSVCSYLANREAVRKSRQLPFRFLSAYRELREFDVEHSELGAALEQAVSASTENIPGFDADTRVLLACDVSGSMRSPVSANSKIEYYDIGLLLAMLMKTRCQQVVTGIFGDVWRPLEVPGNDVLKSMDEMHKYGNKVGFSTNGHKVINWLARNKTVLDKVFFFTDCQMWNSSYYNDDSLRRSWKSYKQVAPEAKLYLFDLCGYGSTPLSVKDDDVFLIAGWSDKVFDMLQAIERGEEVLSQIKAIEL